MKSIISKINESNPYAKLELTKEEMDDLISILNGVFNHSSGVVDSINGVRKYKKLNEWNLGDVEDKCREFEKAIMPGNLKRNK